MLTSALVFDDNESLDFADSQRKEALFRHYKDQITTKINAVAASFANSTDQQNARKIGNVIGSICTNLILAKGTAIVTEEVIGTIAKVTENLTNIVKGETGFVATLVDLEPSVKKTLTPFTTSLEEASEIAETAHLRPNPGYKPKAPRSAQNLSNKRGQAFENFLEKELKGKGSFTAKSANTSREFDGAVGNVWYEAKSGKYWDMIVSSKDKLGKFKSDMGRGLSVTKAHGVVYELHSNIPIPQSIKDWLTVKGIKFTEWL